MTIVFSQSRGISLPTKIIARDIRRAVSILRRRRIRFTPRVLTIVALSPTAARAVNQMTRRRRYVPSVLSFHYGREAEIILAPTVIRREASTAGNQFRTQLRWMTIHSLVHLSGIHHERGRAAERTFIKIEKVLLDALGILIRR